MQGITYSRTLIDTDADRHLAEQRLKKEAEPEHSSVEKGPETGSALGVSAQSPFKWHTDDDARHTAMALRRRRRELKADVARAEEELSFRTAGLEAAAAACRTAVDAQAGAVSAHRQVNNNPPKRKAEAMRAKKAAEKALAVAEAVTASTRTLAYMRAEAIFTEAKVRVDTMQADLARAEAEEEPTYQEYETFARATGGKGGSDQHAIHSVVDTLGNPTKTKEVKCVPPWQQDQLVPKGFKAAKFIRATGGGRGSDREALNAKHAGDEDSPVVFNAPMNCVPPWQLDHPEKESTKILEPDNLNEDRIHDGLSLKYRAAARNMPMHSFRPYGTHDEMTLEQDAKREEKRASPGKSSAASWRGEVSKPPWVHGNIEAVVESDADKAATLVSTLAAATARAQAFDEDLAAAEELTQAIRLESAGFNAELVKFAVIPSILEMYTTIIHYEEPLRVGLTRSLGFARLSCVGPSRNATQSAFVILSFARTSK